MGRGFDDDKLAGCWLGRINVLNYRQPTPSPASCGPIFFSLHASVQTSQTHISIPKRSPSRAAMGPKGDAHHGLKVFVFLLFRYWDTIVLE